MRLEYAYTTLIDTLLEDIDEIDKFSSLSNGICIKHYSSLTGVEHCQYIDSLYSNATQQNVCSKKTLFSINVYPGARAFSILNAPSNKYIYESGYCQHFGEANNRYTEWKTTQTEDTDVLFVYNKLNLDTLTMPIITSLTNTELEEVPFSLAQIIFSTCPTGFYLNEEICDCVEILKNHGYSCDIEYRNFTSPKGYWTTFTRSVNESIILIDEYCPPNYCVQEMQSFTLNSNLTHTSCVGNRSGVLCGECRDGFSVVFGSDRCYSKCTDLYLLTIPVYILAGIINGVIFYANLLGLVMNQMTGNYNGSHSMKIVFDIVRLVISILNLDLGFPLCFYEGMTPAAKVGFQFLFPVYLWCMVVFLIVISRYSIKVSNLIATSSVQVLSTLFYLSFSKLLSTVITIFSSASITEVIYSNEIYDNACLVLQWHGLWSWHSWLLTLLGSVIHSLLFGPICSILHFFVCSHEV